MIRSGISVFDSLADGLPAPGSHLVYGESGVGKTSFALQFLHWGLSQGERGLLVTRRMAGDVLQHADGLGFSLRSFLRSGHLRILEYTPDVVERATRAKEFSQVIDEFHFFARQGAYGRVVFDPLTPLIQGMNASEIALRVRSLVQGFRAYSSTNLFLLDLPEGASHLPSCREVMQTVVRFEPAGSEGVRAMVLERMPGTNLAARRIPFVVVPGQGIIEAVPEAPAAASERRRVLVVSSDAALREATGRALADECEVSECHDALQAVARLAATPADLMIIDADLEGNNAIQACVELRRNQLNLPIVVLGARQKRLRDRLSVLAQGIDEFLEKPVDGRLLRVRVRALLRRYSPRDRFQAQRDDEVVLSNLKRERPAHQTLSDLAELRAALQEESALARQQGAPYSVCVLEMGASREAESSGMGTLADTVLRFTRPCDRVYHNGRRLVVVLPETNEAGARAFVRRVTTAHPTFTFPTTRVHAFENPAADGRDFKAVLADVLSAGGREAPLEVT